MTRIRVTYVQEYDLPSGAEVVSWIAGDLIKIGEEYFTPSMELLVANTPLGDQMSFEQPEDERYDEIFSALASEQYSVQALN